MHEYHTQAPRTDEVVRCAENLGIAVYSESSLNGFTELVDRLSPACVVVSSYDRVLPERLKNRKVDVTQIARVDSQNISSILSRRGASPCR